MGWIESLGQLVALDTAPLIYYVEEHPDYIDLISPFFTAVEKEKFTVVTSLITYLEVLVGPIRKGDTAVVEKYRKVLFKTDGLVVVTLSGSIAERAAELRASSKIAIADAIQIATALDQSATHFLTNDRQLRSVPGLQVLQLDDLKTP